MTTLMDLILVILNLDGSMNSSTIADDPSNMNNTPIVTVNSSTGITNNPPNNSTDGSIVEGLLNDQLFYTISASGEWTARPSNNAAGGFVCATLVLDLPPQPDYNTTLATAYSLDDLLNNRPYYHVYQLPNEVTRREAEIYCNNRAMILAVILTQAQNNEVRI